MNKKTCSYPCHDFKELMFKLCEYNFTLIVGWKAGTYCVERLRKSLIYPVSGAKEAIHAQSLINNYNAVTRKGLFSNLKKQHNQLSCSGSDCVQLEMISLTYGWHCAICIQVIGNYFSPIVETYKKKFSPCWTGLPPCTTNFITKQDTRSYQVPTFLS